MPTLTCSTHQQFLISKIRDLSDYLTFFNTHNLNTPPTGIDVFRKLSEGEAIAFMLHKTIPNGVKIDANIDPWQWECGGKKYPPAKPPMYKGKIRANTIKILEHQSSVDKFKDRIVQLSYYGDLYKDEYVQYYSDVLKKEFPYHWEKIYVDSSLITQCLPTFVTQYNNVVNYLNSLPSYIYTHNSSNLTLSSMLSNLTSIHLSKIRLLTPSISKNPHVIKYYSMWNSLDTFCDHFNI